VIYCVELADVVAHLERQGFTEHFTSLEGRRLFVRGDDPIYLHPNHEGHCPEIHVNGQFEASGLVPPEWSVFWCD
jgi:hypothetical protein